MEVIARLIRVLLPAVPDERRDEVMLEFNDALAELTPLIAQASPGGGAAIDGPNGSQKKLYTDEENLSLAQVEEIRRRHWERSERWIRELSDDEVWGVQGLALHRLSIERNGDVATADPWKDRLCDEWYKRCQNRPVTHRAESRFRHPFPLPRQWCWPSNFVLKRRRREAQRSATQQAATVQPAAQQTTELGG